MGRHSKSLAYALRKLSEDRYKQYIYAIYLYGSCARGDFKHDSDVDLFLVLEPGVPRALIREMKWAVTPDDLELPAVELKTGTLGDFSNSRQFDENIRNEGKLLWKRD